MSERRAVTYPERVACAENTHKPYRAKAVFVAGGEILSLVHAFKYRRHRFLGDAMGKLMSLSLHDSSLLRRDSVLLPVPLHRTRMRERTFNQSEILAGKVAETAGIPVIAGALERKRLTMSQAELPAERRWLNVRDSFTVKMGSLVEGRDIILVDDVVTTGATVSSCAGVLEDAGAKSVSVLGFVVA
ncbi:MAG: phosphoribosyltransferase family protein [Candidatus Eisenbacteria bacterium]|nr:phosphoribosyltransferase family protein [Candidatus Eisenbacteria bacterium]